MSEGLTIPVGVGVGRVVKRTPSCVLCRAAKKEKAERHRTSMPKQLGFLREVSIIHTLNTHEILENGYSYCNDALFPGGPITRLLSRSSSDRNDRCTALPVHAKLRRQTVSPLALVEHHLAFAQLPCGAVL
jgi:hypothetical protein